MLCQICTIFTKYNYFYSGVKFCKWSHGFHEYTNMPRMNTCICFLSSLQIPYMLCPSLLTYLSVKRREPDKWRRNISISERRSKEEIVEWWHHSSRVEVWSFYSHVLSVWHIPQPQKPPPPPPVLVSSSFIEHQTKWCDANRAEQRRWGTWRRGRWERVFANSEGKGRNFPELPHQVCLTTSPFLSQHSSSVWYFYFHW